MTARPSDVLRAIGAITLIDSARLELVSVRPAGAGLLLTLRRADGRMTSIRCTTADQPGLERLNDADRGRVRSALLALNRGGPRDAA